MTGPNRCIDCEETAWPCPGCGADSGRAHGVHHPSVVKPIVTAAGQGLGDGAPREKKPATKPVRLPDDLAAEITRWAKVNGITPAQMMQRAWDHYWLCHGNRICDEIQEAIEAMRPEGDTHG